MKRQALRQVLGTYLCKIGALSGRLMTGWGQSSYQTLWFATAVAELGGLGQGCCRKEPDGAGQGELPKRGCRWVPKE